MPLRTAGQQPARKGVITLDMVSVYVIDGFFLFLFLFWPYTIINGSRASLPDTAQYAVAESWPTAYKPRGVRVGVRVNP